ncbi:MAG: zinc ABC transporter substrate-binding protein [Phycisphaeraceae bacterium]
MKLTDFQTRIGSFVLMLVVLLAGCDGKEPTTTDGKQMPVKSRFVIVCTTTINHEIALLLADDLVHPIVDIRSLCQLGDDPHDYIVRPGDLQSLREADVILMNGLGLEATLEPLIAEHAKDATIIRLGEATGVTHLPGADGKPDPHVWMSPANYEAMVRRAGEGLARLIVKHAPVIQLRSEDYRAQVADLHGWVLNKARELPTDRRVVLVSDGGLNYLGQLLGVRIVHHKVDPAALATEADRDALFAAVDREKVNAVFIDRGESSVWHDVVADLSGMRRVTVGPALRSHELAEKEHVAGTYLGLIRADVESIVQVLSMEPALKPVPAAGGS